jgi:hypothetical protein
MALPGRLCSIIRSEMPARPGAASRGRQNEARGAERGAPGVLERADIWIWHRPEVPVNGARQSRALRCRGWITTIVSAVTKSHGCIVPTARSPAWRIPVVASTGSLWAPLKRSHGTDVRGLAPAQEREKVRLDPTCLTRRTGWTIERLWSAQGALVAPSALACGFAIAIRQLGHFRRRQARRSHDVATPKRTNRACLADLNPGLGRRNHL